MAFSKKLTKKIIAKTSIVVGILVFSGLRLFGGGSVNETERTALNVFDDVFYVPSAHADTPSSSDSDDIGCAGGGGDDTTTDGGSCGCGGCAGDAGDGGASGGDGACSC